MGIIRGLWLLKEIASDELRSLCAKVKDRRAPATAVIVRDIVQQILGVLPA